MHVQFTWSSADETLLPTGHVIPVPGVHSDLKHVNLKLCVMGFDHAAVFQVLFECRLSCRAESQGKLRQREVESPPKVAGFLPWICTSELKAGSRPKAQG